MDNTPAVKPQEEMKSLSAAAIIQKSKDPKIGWKRTPVRSQKFSTISKEAVMAQGTAAQGVQGNIGKDLLQGQRKVMQNNAKPTLAQVQNQGPQKIGRNQQIDTSPAPQPIKTKNKKNLGEGFF